MSSLSKGSNLRRGSWGTSYLRVTLLEIGGLSLGTKTCGVFTNSGQLVSFTCFLSCLLYFLFCFALFCFPFWLSLSFSFWEFFNLKFTGFTKIYLRNNHDETVGTTLRTFLTYSFKYAFSIPEKKYSIKFLTCFFL